MPILTAEQVNELIGGLKNDPNVKGVLLTGSYAYGEPNDDSDIEIVCITKDESNSFDPGLKFKNVPTEIFFNSPEKIRNEYWRQAIEEGHGDCVHFWANGKIMYDEDGIVKELQEEARTLWLMGPPNRSHWEWRWKKHGKGYPKAEWEMGH